MAETVLALRELRARHEELEATCKAKDVELSQLREFAAAGALAAPGTDKVIELAKKVKHLRTSTCTSLSCSC
jgi:hypothetical protein